MGGSKIRCFWAVLKFKSQEVPLERAIWCSSELTKGREHPAYVCKWKCQSKHGVSMLQDVRLTHPRHGEEWWRATERNWSLEKVGTATRRGIRRPLVRIDGCRCARTLYCRLRCLPLFTSGLPADSRLRSGPANEPTLTRSSTTTSALRLQRRRQGLFCPTAGENFSRERDCLPLLGASCA